MTIKVQWMDKYEEVKERSFTFQFSSPENLFTNGDFGVGYFKPEEALYFHNNLVITGFGDINPLPYFEMRAVKKGRKIDGTARIVYPVLNHPDLPFRAGLTLHAARGTWSSLPHEFEREEILTPRPAPFYEKFAYITAEPGGWGIQTRIGHLFEQRLNQESISNPYHDYDPDWINDVVVVRDRDILDIPLGSHPYTCGPGVLGGYFWIYWGSLEGREKFTKDKAL